MKTIIVADDSNIIVNIVKRAFEGEYNVISAQNGEEAIQLLQNNNLDDIVGMLLDLNMPGVDGFAVLEYLKNNNLFLKVPVSIITGDDDMDVISKAFEYNIIDVLKKPFNVDNIKKIVEKTISIRSINNM
ncbi:MAG: response regulator [Firmicutes bacterium]|nr:response regulator [Bacillota bacterium]